MCDASGQGVMYSQAVAQRLGINSTDLECLDHIVLRGPLTAGALAEATGLTTGAITGVIDPRPCSRDIEVAELSRGLTVRIHLSPAVSQLRTSYR
jgi:hypothetical protein